MAFITLFTYSYHKSPKYLKQAIIYCKLSIFLLIIFFVLLIILFNLARYSFLLAFGEKPTDLLLNGNHSSLISSDEERGEGDNETLIRLNRVKDTPSGSLKKRTFLVEYYGIVSLVTAAAVLIGSLACSIVAYRSYKKYQQYRLVSYETVNRRFDHQRLKEMTNRYIQEPIIHFDHKNSSKVFIDDNNNNNNNNNRNNRPPKALLLEPKVSAWAKTKLKFSNNRPRTNDMTI